jgi:short-subunit dehydrogenase
MIGHGLPSHIANVASIASYMAVPQFGVYCGSKKYVRDLSETLNYEFKNSNIHFTCISPGGTWTEFMDNSSQKVKKSANATMMTSDQVAQIGLNAMYARKHSVITGWLNWFMCLAPKFIPSKWMMALTHHSMSMGVEYVDKRQS